MRLLAVAVLAFTALACGASQRPAAAPRAFPEGWAELAFLAGEWSGTGDGATGPSTGTNSFTPDLGGHVLVRHGVNEYKGGRHEVLMVIYHTADGKTRASYFDGEGHAIGYGVTTSEDRAVLESDEVPGVPRFRLTYLVTAPDHVKVDFEIQVPGQAVYRSYVHGDLQRR